MSDTKVQKEETKSNFEGMRIDEIYHEVTTSDYEEYWQERKEREESEEWN